MAIAFRVVLSRARPPTRAQLTAHYKWQLNDVLMIYAAAFVASMASAFLIRASPGLAQVLDAVARLKVVGLMMLFIYCISTGRGIKWVFLVVLFEIAIGFTGFLSDFRAVFIFLGIAAIAARVKWKGSTTVGAVLGATVLNASNGGSWTPLGFCHETGAFLTQAKFLGSYLIPRVGVQVSAPNSSSG